MEIDTTCPSSLNEIRGVDVFLTDFIIRIRFTNGSQQFMPFDEANKRIKVNGVQIIDWYAKKN